jgi:hypothetical protein
LINGTFPRGVGDDATLGVTSGRTDVTLAPENVPLVTPCEGTGCNYNYSTTVITGRGGPVDFNDVARISNTIVPAANNQKAQPITNYSTQSHYANGTLTEGGPISFNILPPFISVFFIMKIQ